MFRLFKLLVFMAYKGGFFVLEYRKRHFPGIYFLKKKVGKMVNFGPKLLVNPFGKTSVFGLFELFVFIGYKGVFLMYNIVKDIYYIKKKFKKEHF